MKKNLFALIALITLSACACAQVAVTNAWVRATVPAQNSTGAFMTMTSARDARLVSVTADIAGDTQIHQMAMSGDMMKMQQIDGIDLPAGKPVNLASGGYHLMLMMLKRQARAGEHVALALLVQYKDGKRATVKVDAPVKPAAYNPAQEQH
jgi:copper(I)-binding protein